MAKNKDLNPDIDSVAELQDANNGEDLKTEDFLNDVELDSQNQSFVNAPQSQEDEDNDNNQFQPEEMIDFANFNIDDFDAALNSYQAARAGQSLTIEPPAKKQSKKEKKQEKAQQAVQKVAEPPVRVETQMTSQLSSQTDYTLQSQSRLSSQTPQRINPQTIDERGFQANNRERQQDIMYWYSGNLSDKTYRISADRMPEFLDSDKTIRIVHIEVDSVYGWNVFFDNGVFMSLRDLKEYQERHGEMPCQDGKFVYGNKTSTFERILKVVVYERPRYFSYRAK